MKKALINQGKIENLLSKGVAEVVVKNNLEKLLKSGKKLRIKLGIDPTAPDLHLGHTVPLRKLKQFQDLGHRAVLIIGDFTAMIGDPSGRSIERKPLTKKEVAANMKKYLVQAGKIIDLKKAEIVRNSAWLAEKKMTEAVEILKAGTFQQVMHRADFKKRLDEGRDITMAEIFYPILQGYDSVKVKADVELGGTDQTFNLLMGRRVQRHFGMKEQDVMTVPLLEGTDGVRKMSKSLGNYIALTDSPDEMFGKIMAIPDGLIDKYYSLLTDILRTEDHPREAKFVLAQEITSLYHGKNKAEKARKKFFAVFVEKKKPEDMPEIVLNAEKVNIVDLIIAARFAYSKNEARRLVEQGAVRVNDERKTDVQESISLASGIILQVGPRRFICIRKAG